MKRRDFLRYSGAGVAALGTTSLLSSCSQEYDGYKFWQHGNFPPVSEEVTETSLKIEGALPPELDGLYVRNGCNAHSGVADHFFGGDGMLHGIRLEKGEAKWYRNRYVETPFLRDEYSRFSMPTPEQTTSAVSVINHGGKLLSLGEFGLPYEINSEDLSTVGPYTYEGKMNGNMTAHPRIDPVTGEMIFFGYNVMKPYLTYMRADAQGNLIQLEPIETNYPVMMHDFAVTENYVVFMEMPLGFSWWLAISGAAMPFRWNEDIPTRFGVMPRTGTSKDVKWFDVPTCFVFHVMNSFEQGDEVVIDAARYDKLWVKDEHDFNYPAYLSRFTLNMKTGKTTGVQRMAEGPLEFPQVNRGYWTRSYRYGYGVGNDVDKPRKDLSEELITDIVKFDMQTGETTGQNMGKAFVPGEAVFAPARSNGAEDEGYLITYVYDKATKTSDLWVMDASNISAKPVAKVKLPVRVPVGFHGVWVPTTA